MVLTALVPCHCLHLTLDPEIMTLSMRKLRQFFDKLSCFVGGYTSITPQMNSYKSNFVIKDLYFLTVLFFYYPVAGFFSPQDNMSV